MYSPSIDATLRGLLLVWEWEVCQTFLYFIPLAGICQSWSGEGTAVLQALCELLRGGDVGQIRVCLKIRPLPTQLLSLKVQLTEVSQLYGNCFLLA